MRNIFSRKKDKRPKLRKPINFRKWTRFIFRFLLIGLIVGSCTQSVAWLGNLATNDAAHRPTKRVYDYNGDVIQDINEYTNGF